MKPLNNVALFFYIYFLSIDSIFLTVNDKCLFMDLDKGRTWEEFATLNVSTKRIVIGT